MLAALLLNSYPTTSAAPKRRGYVVKGNYYWLTEWELAWLIADLIAEEEKVKVKGKKRTQKLSKAIIQRIKEEFVTLTPDQVQEVKTEVTKQIAMKNQEELLILML